MSQPLTLTILHLQMGVLSRAQQCRKATAARYNEIRNVGKPENTWKSEGGVSETPAELRGLCLLICAFFPNWPTMPPAAHTLLHCCPLHFTLQYYTHTLKLPTDTLSPTRACCLLPQSTLMRYYSPSLTVLWLSPLVDGMGNDNAHTHTKASHNRPCDGSAVLCRKTRYLPIARPLFCITVWKAVMVTSSPHGNSEYT